MDETFKRDENIRDKDGESFLRHNALSVALDIGDWTKAIKLLRYPLDHGLFDGDTETQLMQFLDVFNYILTEESDLYFSDLAAMYGILMQLENLDPNWGNTDKLVITIKIQEMMQRIEKFVMQGIEIS